MAQFYELVAEFGQNRTAAESFANFLADKKLEVYDGSIYCIDVGVGNIDHVLYPNGSIWGIAIVKDFEFTKSIEVAHQIDGLLYGLLKCVGGYRYAAAGVEAECIGSWDEIKLDLERSPQNGLVVGEQMLSNLKLFAEPVLFSPGYLWWPSWRPRMSRGKWIRNKRRLVRVCFKNPERTHFLGDSIGLAGKKAHENEISY